MVFDYTLAYPLIAAGARNLVGYLNNYLEDGKVSAYEWTQLGKTVLTIGITAFAAMFAFDMDPAQASALSVFLELMFSNAKKIIKK